jgi:hypothetical protein
VGLESAWYVGLSYQPRMMDDECGEVVGMRIDEGNRSTWKEPSLVPLCPPQIPHVLTRTPLPPVGSRRLTSRATARPSCKSHGLILVSGVSSCYVTWVVHWLRLVLSKGPSRVGFYPSHLRTETDPVSETLCFLAYRIPDDGQSPETQWSWFSTSLVHDTYMLVTYLRHRFSYCWTSVEFTQISICSTV